MKNGGFRIFEFWDFGILKFWGFEIFLDSNINLQLNSLFGAFCLNLGKASEPFKNVTFTIHTSKFS